MVSGPLAPSSQNVSRTARGQLEGGPITPSLLGRPLVEGRWSGCVFLPVCWPGGSHSEVSSAVAPVTEESQLGCWTEHWGLGWGMDHRNVLLNGLAGSSRSGCPQAQGHFLFVDSISLLVPTRPGGEGTFWGLLHRDILPLTGLCPHHQVLF